MSNNDNWGLIIFAFVALAAVFAFILVLGGPPDPQSTGNLAGSQRPATSDFEYRTGQKACAHANCNDGLPAVPTGNYDRVRELYECVCQTSDPSFIMWRSPYGKAG